MDMIRIRASSLSELFDCPKRWEAMFLRGLRLPTAGAAQLGTAVHAGTARYDISRMNDEGLTADDCAGAIVDAIYHPESDIDWGETSQNEVETIAIDLHKRYCKEIAPKQHYVAVEALCDKLDITDLGIELTGTTDRIRETEDGELAISDLKTGKTIVSPDGTVKTAGYAAQLSVYTLLAQAAIGRPITGQAQIIGLQTAKTDRGRRVAVGNCNASIELLTGDEDTPGLLQYAANILQSGTFYGNPRSSLCSAKFCPCWQQCQFK